MLKRIDYSAKLEEDLALVGLREALQAVIEKNVVQDITISHPSIWKR